jgi:predicted TIM-barrel fold metal-dependent hydrolase
MIIDCHVHTHENQTARENLLKQLDAADVGRIILLSYHPACFSVPESKGDDLTGRVRSFEENIREVMEWAAFSDRIVPFFWIDPLEEDAFEQVDKAVAAGIAGFKAICTRHYPGDKRPMDVWNRIAQAGKPILFHSGIIYSPTPSSKYNKPIEFEPLFDIPRLRFAMAHISWPWCDEMLAVYGYWRYRKGVGNTSAELFIDTTPGTPRIYRRDVFFKIYRIGYDIEDNVIFGTDGSTAYNPAYTRQILDMDKEALDAAGVTEAQREKYYGTNVLRFIGG